LKTLQKQVFWTDVRAKKRVNDRMLDWKHYKNTVKSNVLEGFLWQKTCKLPSV